MFSSRFTFYQFKRFLGLTSKSNIWGLPKNAMSGISRLQDCNIGGLQVCLAGFRIAGLQDCKIAIIGFVDCEIAEKLIIQFKVKYGGCHIARQSQ